MIPREQLTEKQLKNALEQCANEPIHIPGAIQPYGFLLAVSHKTSLISYVSDNVEKFTGFSVPECLGHPAVDILGAGADEVIASIAVENSLQPIQSKRVDVRGKIFDLVAHRTAEDTIVEFEPAKEKYAGVDAFYDVTRNFAVGVHRAKELPELFNHIVHSVRQVTGIDRVKLYRFDEEWNGSVVAESKAEHMPSYLGMRFPASDIPEQARILYTKSYIRIIPDIHYAPAGITSVAGNTEPLDLSFANLRSVSPVHIQYLDNMRVRASMSVSIIQNGKLWGLIACHHNEPLYVPYQARMVAEIMGHIFSAQLSTMENTVKREEKDAQKLFLERLNSALERNYQLTTLMESTNKHALWAMKASGMIVHSQEQTLKFGNVPSDDKIEVLLAWLTKHQNHTIYHATDASTISGLENLYGGFLSASINQNQNDFVIWFRSSIAEEVRWAGNPEKPLEQTYAGYRLTPRASFEEWKRVVRRRCATWDSDNLETARNFVSIVLESEKISAQQANLAKSEFLANMSHEIRTPMNAVIGLSNLLSMSKPLTEKQKSFIDTLQTSADSLLSLINDLLDISKIEARSIELEELSFNMDEIIQQVISISAVKAKDKNLKLVVKDDCVKGKFYVGDPTRLRQIILNLVSNAVKFTEQGRITLEANCLESSKEGYEALVVKVIDTGIGIPSSKLESIFKKFEQADNSINRKFGGTGLGLAITKSLVEVMGGSVYVESQFGVGSTFTVKLDMKLGDNQSIPDDSSETRVSQSERVIFHEKKILLVDDHQPNIMVAGLYLTEFGYRYDIATTGQQAFDYAQNNDYLAILMDVQMHGMNGFEATKLIRDYEKLQNKKSAFIIGLTAHALAGDRERCISAGMDEYMSKPLDPELMNKLISTAT